jgi:tyrosine-protein kinase Etk/Wzc
MQNKPLINLLELLIKWKNFIFINLLIIIILTTAYVFMIPKTFRSTTVVMIPPESGLGLGGLTSVLSGKGGGSFGAKLLGLGSTSSEDMILGILNSRSALENVIGKFDLMDYYEIDENNIDKALRSFKNDLSFSPNEYGFIEISVINKEPELAAEIANYFIQILDSISIKLSVEHARNNRLFIENRYYQNLADLKSAEDSMLSFQQKNKIVAVPEQLEIAVRAAGELEKELAQAEISANSVAFNFGENSPQYASIKSQIDMMRKKIKDLKNSESLNAESNILFPFKGMPNISLSYFRLFREIEVQNKILEVILPMYEQAKIEEQKNIPTIMVVDKAVPPILKYAPKRAFILIGITLFSFFSLVIAAAMLEGILKYNAETQSKRTVFVNRITRRYKIV